MVSIDSAFSCSVENFSLSPSLPLVCTSGTEINTKKPCFCSHSARSCQQEI